MITLLFIITLIKILEFRKAKRLTTRWHDTDFRLAQVWDYAKMILTILLIVLLYEFDLIRILVKFIIG